MNKILTLGVKDWITGVGVGQHFEGSGLFTTADGINPFVDPFLNSAGFGLLQPGRDETDISAAVVDQIINTIIPRNLTYFYGLGAIGDFYRITIADNTVQQTTNGDAVVKLINGFIMTNSLGTEKMYYICDTLASANYLEIGTWDFATTFDNDAITAAGNNLEPTAFKPIHYWQDIHWIGNAYKIAKIDNAEALTLAALTLDRSFVVTALEDDGYRLIIGCSSETGGTIKGQTKIYFWDGAGTKPEKVFNVPETDIRGMKKIGDMIYAICGRALYAFNYATAPTKILDFDTNHSPGNPKHLSRIGNALLWGGVDVNMYGSFNARVKNCYATPWSFALRATTVSALNAEINPGTIYVAGANSKLYTISTTTGGNPGGVSKTATTHFIDLKDVYNIQGITVIFGLNLASGDSVDIVLTNRNDDSQTSSALFSTHGAVSRLHFPVSLKADQVKVAITFQNTNPKIKDIILYGEKTIEL